MRASEISEIWRISFWDAMIVAAAKQDQVAELWSEDLSHGLIIDGIRVVNPFIPQPK